MAALPISQSRFIPLHAAAMALSYIKKVLWKRTHSFGDVRVGFPLATGIVVEPALKLAYAPPQGTLPKVLERQRAADHKTVRVGKIIQEGQRPRTEILSVPAADAELAITIVRKVVDALKAELELTIITADHYKEDLPTPQPG